MKARIIKIAIIVFLSLGAFFGYQRFSAQQAASRKVDTAKVKRGDLKETLTISGKIDADEHVTLRFQTSGNLSWVGVREGDYVRKYQGVASLDQREVQDNLKKYLQAYMKSRWDFETQKDTSGDPAAMTTALRRALDKAQFDLNSAVLDVEIKNLAVQFANLWTPIEGLVTRVESPYAGVNITPTQAEFEIINPKTVFFLATADQTEVTKISASQSGALKLDAYPDQEVSGSVGKISFVPDTAETGTVYDVKFLFNDNNSDYRYKVGMTGDLSFVTNRKDNILYLPGKFIKSESGKKYVNQKINGRVSKAFVQTGMEADDGTEIISGLNEGDTVID